MTFSAEATGTEPLSYQWEWKRKKKWGRSGKWQSCDSKWCYGATLTIPKVENSHTGSYRCVVSNHIGSQTSNPANLNVGKHPVYIVSAACRLLDVSIFPFCVAICQSHIPCYLSACSSAPKYHHSSSSAPKNHHSSTRVKGCCSR